MNEERPNAIQQGLERLAALQAADGSFPSLTSSDPVAFSRATSCASVFSTALIVPTLVRLRPHPIAEQMIGRATAFLQSQASEDWTWNYWVRESPQSQQLPYPDDLDDTACALAALTVADRSAVGGDVLAKFVRVLTAVEQQVGGPYGSWVVGPEAEAVWKDVDLAVNSNIAYFLSLHDVTLPSLVSLAETAIEQQTFSSPYYPSPYPILFFIARWYRGEEQRDLARYIWSRKRHDQWGTILETALAVSSLLHLGVVAETLEPSIGHIASAIQQQVRPHVFYTGINPNGDKKFYYAGSEALTLAACLEALSLFQEVREKHAHKTNVTSAAFDLEMIQHQIVSSMRDRCNHLPAAFGERARFALEALVRSKTDQQIMLLPAQIALSFGATPEQIPASTLVDLGTASLCGWIAYTIYDDVIDGEPDASLLPVANLCVRDMMRIFSAVLSQKTEFLEIVNVTLDTMGAAHVWELGHCRFLAPPGALDLTDDVLPAYGEYEHLAERAQGHSLGAVAVAMHLGYGADSPTVRQLQQFFHHYLIARQLNDEAHDWEEDLQSGHVNAAGALLLRELYGDRPEQQIDLSESGRELLRNHFWRSTIVSLCDAIDHHVAQARAALDTCDGIVDRRLYETLLSVPADAAVQARTQRQQTLSFLQSYSPSPPETG